MQVICRADGENIPVRGEDSIEERAVVGTLERFYPRVKRRTSWRWCLTGGSALATEERPLVALTSIREDAHTALTPVIQCADLGAISLLLAEDGGGVGYASLLCRCWCVWRGTGNQQD